MLKKTLFVGSAAALLMALLFGRDACSYVKTTVGWMKDSVRESVPVEFEIERARKMLTELHPEIRRNMHLIAKEEVEVERMEAQVSDLENKLTKDQTDILQLKKHVDTGDDYLYHAGQRYSLGEVKIDLANRFARFKTNDETLGNLRKVLRARELSLEAARKKLEEMLAARRNLTVDVENLEARQKMVQVARTTSDFNFDDSHLARTKELITNIRTRIQVAEKLMHVETNFHDGIPLDQPDVDDISNEIAEYFGTRQPTMVAAAEKE